jgi:hypothetical protein
MHCFYLGLENAEWKHKVKKASCALPQFRRARNAVTPEFHLSPLLPGLTLAPKRQLNHLDMQLTTCFQLSSRCLRSIRQQDLRQCQETYPG